MDLKLPDIVPAGPAPSAAGAIEQMGANVKRTAEGVGGLLHEADMAQVTTQLQEAMLQTSKGLTDKLQFIKSNPYVTPEVVKDLFGGKPPASIPLTEPQYTAGQDQPVQVPRKVIPMHEVVTDLFDAQAAAVVNNATAGVDSGWQGHFKQAAAKDVERARAEALDWQRAQRLADAEIKTEAQLAQLAAGRNWNGYQAVLDTPQNQLSVAKREAYRANLPALRTHAVISDRLRSGSLEELTKLTQDIASNRRTQDGGKDGGFFAELSAEEQYKYTAVAHARKEEIIREQERAEKRAAEARFEGFGDKVQAAVNESLRTGRPVSSMVSVADIPMDLKFHEFVTYKGFLDGVGTKERKTDNRVWAELSEADRSGKLATFSKADMMKYWPGLSEEHQRTWMDRWEKAVAGGGPPKPMFSDDEDKNIDAVLRFYKFDRNKNEDEYLTAKSMLQQNLTVWRERHPGKPLDYATVRGEAAFATFNASTDVGRSWLVNDPDTPREWVQKYLPDNGATSVLLKGIYAARPGVPVSNLTLKEHLGQMDKESTLVEEAWSALGADVSPLSGAHRAAIHSVLINPRELEQVDARLRAGNKDPNQRARVFEIVRSMAAPQGAERRAAYEKKAQEAADAKAVGAAGDALRAVGTAETAMQKAEREVAAAVERRRREGLPDWERRAEDYAATGFRAQEDALTAQIRARVYAEDRQAQLVEAKGKAIIGQRFAEDPVRIEMDKRIAAEAAVGRADRQAAWDAQMAEARRQYRTYWEDNMRASDGSVKAFAPPGFVDSFDKWLALRKAGKL